METYLIIHSKEYMHITPNGVNRDGSLLNRFLFLLLRRQLTKLKSLPNCEWKVRNKALPIQ